MLRLATPTANRGISYLLFIGLGFVCFFFGCTLYDRCTWLFSSFLRLSAVTLRRFFVLFFNRTVSASTLEVYINKKFIFSLRF